MSRKANNILLFSVVAAGVISFAVGSFQGLFSHRVYPRVWIGVSPLSLSGKTEGEIVAMLSQFEEILSQEYVTFFTSGAQEKKVSISPVIFSTDPNLSRELITFSPEITAERALELGRQGNALQRAIAQARLLMEGRQILPDFFINRDELLKILEVNFSSLEKSAQSPRLLRTPSGELYLTFEEAGISLDFDTAIAQLEQALSELSLPTIEIKLQRVLPEVSFDEAYPLLEEAKEIVSTSPLTIMFEGFPETGSEGKTWSIGEDTLITLLTFTKKQSRIGVAFDELRLGTFLETITSTVNVPPQEANLLIDGGRVVTFSPPQVGFEVNIEKTILEAQQALGERRLQFSLVAERKEPVSVLADINTLGIQELVAEGRSNFKGSPPNRRHNISVGAKKLNGLLIAPGEEFSLVKALGKTNASTGYLPELVIKGDRTIPEYGGGLCQIATTLFRLALNAGLPITERREHSYRVRYYEPAGIDATIYDPRPDLKFINNTPAHLLLTTRIEGNDLIFEFWGTSDGRKTEISTPKIWNIVSPGPTQLIETEDLKEGDKKCIERSVPGAQAEFTRVIVFPTGERKEEIWESRYRPWPEVCLIGKKATIESAEGLSSSGSLSPL